MVDPITLVALIVSVLVSLFEYSVLYKFCLIKTRLSYLLLRSFWVNTTLRLTDIANASLPSWDRVSQEDVKVVLSTRLTDRGGKRTYLRWRWREFRFETLYAVPRLTFALPELREDNRHYIRAFIEPPDLQAAQVTADKDMREADSRGELVGWVYMLQYLGLHDMHARKHVIPYIRHQQHVTHHWIYHEFLRCPKADIASRSWDFVPIDVVRPLAMTTVSAAAIAARRLGMTWKQFEPSTGTFLAEGNHQVITSTVIRGLGTVLQYTRDPILDEDPIGQAVIQRTSAVHMSDDLAFGRLGRYAMFNSHDFLLLVGNWTDVAATLGALFLDTQSGDLVISTLKSASDSGSKDWMGLANDIVPFLSPYLGVSNIERPIIPWPNPSSRGLSCTGFRAFEDCLTVYISSVIERGFDPVDARYLLALYQSLKNDLNGPNRLWEVHAPSLAASLDLFAPVETQTIHNALVNLDNVLTSNLAVRAGKYKDIIAWHLVIMCSSFGTLSDGEKMAKLFQSLPQLSARMKIDWILQRERDGFERPDEADIPHDQIMEAA